MPPRSRARVTGVTGRSATGRIALALAFAAAVCPPFGHALAESAGVSDLLRRSVVRIHTVSQDPDYSVPWNAGHVGQGLGAGFVIDGKRIMTNAHVVSNARFITVRKEGDPNLYSARVAHIAHDCDLAVLEVADPRFFEGTRALQINGIPELESTVFVYGYPIGGDRPSVTRGIVSRIDFQEYSHSGADAHLVIQIDAAINPGNSGGPVLQDGKVVGVAFQGFSGDVAQNTGYMIPTPVIERFLKDIESGSYDHYVDLALTYYPLLNPAARAGLGLADDESGVLVGSVFGGGSAEKFVRRGDVILEIDGLPVANDGTVEIGGKNLEMAEIVERKFRGDMVSLKLLRDGETLEVEFPLERFPFNLYQNAYDVEPRYLIYGGLVFQPVDQNFLAANRVENQRTLYYFDHFLAEHLYREKPELVILSNILSDPVNAYAADFRHQLVDSVNGHEIRTLSDLAEAFEQPGETVVIEFLGGDRPLVLDDAEVRQARERILTRYAIPREANLEL